MAFENQTIWHPNYFGPFEYQTSLVLRSPLEHVVRKSKFQTIWIPNGFEIKKSQYQSVFFIPQNPFPDNYTPDECFLAAIEKNKNLHKYTFNQCLQGSCQVRKRNRQSEYWNPNSSEYQTIRLFEFMLTLWSFMAKVVKPLII